MKKLFNSAEDAIYDISDGASIMAGGFGLCGNPENLIAALARKNVGGLTIISNNCGTTEMGLGVLLKNKQVRMVRASYVGENARFEGQFLNGEIEVELIPQGTLAEKIRAGGAGIAAFFTPTGVGTQVELGGLPMIYDSSGTIVKSSAPKETRVFGGKNYVMEEAITADFALIRAYKADSFGNLVFRKTAQNFSPMMCTAARITIVEAEHLVDEGELDPDEIHVPGIYVNRVFQGTNYQRFIEKLTTTPIPAPH